jgi:hypothetical protein
LLAPERKTTSTLKKVCVCVNVWEKRKKKRERERKRLRKKKIEKKREKERLRQRVRQREALAERDSLCNCRFKSTWLRMHLNRNLYSRSAGGGAGGD